ncbi:MAG: DegT/DnrJ/EryC1/StrS family aminotransferase, partial [Flavobacteriales bacterium]|nr:DegT/DnrJ/EryC1/StrS family aminotransferase [Flavobacteriales bacterium]
FPVFMERSEVREGVEAALIEQGIVPRRYFYPSLNRLPYVKNVPMPVSEHKAATALSLPFYPGLPAEVVERIAATLKRHIG